jgi:hypothetical protein
MSGLRGALAVRVDDGQTDRIVTRYCRGLKFSKVAPGGHQSLSFTMVLPPSMFTDLGPEDRVYVYDARTARTVIEGYLENPTPTDGAEGQQYEVSAVGGMALANDETRALIYVDRDLSQINKSAPSTPSSNVETGLWVGNGTSPRIRAQLTPGQPITTNDNVAAEYTALSRAGMSLGAFNVYVQSGRTDGGYRNRAFFNASSIDLGNTSGIFTTGASETRWAATDFASGTTNYLSLSVFRTGGATNIATDDVWADYVDLVVIGQRMTRYGVLLTGSAGLVSATQVLASQVVEDLLGRILTMCDAGTAQVDATAFGITQLAYPDGVKAAGVLNDLAVFEPDYLWEILESQDNGKHRFNYRAWPTSPRYEFTVADGWQQRGSDVDLCNRILVSWADPTGKTQVTPVTAASLGLVGLGYPVDALGTRVKDADPITLPDGKGSAANATQIGGQILADKINPPKAGTVVVRRPIVDQLTGNLVMPWEIEPGYLGRIRETGDDLRITQVDYDDDTCSATVTLGRPVLTDEQRLARLDRATQTTLLGL